MPSQTVGLLTLRLMPKNKSLPLLIPQGLGPDRFDQDGIICVAAIVSQQLRRTVKIIDHHVDVAVVIDVAKGGATARALLKKRPTQLLSDFGECSVTVVVMHKISLPVTR